MSIVSMVMVKRLHSVHHFCSTGPVAGWARAQYFFWRLCLIVALAMSLPSATAGQDGVPSAQAPVSPPARIPAEPSDLLTHSPLTACSTGGSPNVDAAKRSRIATWNIRAARAAAVDAIAAELQAMQADVIALQEVDVRTRRTGFIDEPAALATALGFHYVFAASIKYDEGDYGLAVLSRWPFAKVRRHRLDATAAAEPRIVLEVTVCARGRPLRLFNHHADGRVASRSAGFAELREIVQADLGHGMLLLGDFNERPDATGVRGLIDAGLVDLGAEHDVNTARSGRIDYLLADGPLARLTSTARVWPTDKSDHHAVLVELEW
jgi:endonuclease/exonuclease/phosphatase family metal-dependent hydrolase